MSEEQVPEIRYASLNSVFPADLPRYSTVLDHYKSLFGTSPHLFVRSPGRVNIIGDHIDYELFSCLPMALNYDLLMACGVNESNTLNIANTDPTYPSGSFTIDKPVAIDLNNLTWIDYFKCGYIVAQQYLASIGITSFKGMTLLADGNIPLASGLSSSAAFVVSATLAVLRLQGVQSISKKKLVELSVQCERHIGANTGGLDQSASVFGAASSLLFVSFFPQLAVRTVTMPETSPAAAFVITNSLVHANKAETAAVSYNLRVVEVTIAANIMAKKLNIAIPQNGNLDAGTLRGVLDVYCGNTTYESLKKQPTKDQLETVIALVESIFGEEKEFTTEQCATLLDCTPQALVEKYMTTFPVRYTKLKLYARAKHVYEEAKRVAEFIEILESQLKDEELLKSLGSLMSASHFSHSHLYENSCSELDMICKIAESSAASYGSRVTGAGFGGCAVHLTSIDKVDILVETLVREYYNVKYPGLTETQLADAILVSSAGVGTAVIRL